MSTLMDATETWQNANQRVLTAALGAVKKHLEHHDRKRGRDHDDDVLEQESIYPPSALERLCALFDLSSFERDILLLCAGVEFDSSFGSLCAAAHDDPVRSYPTFSLALAALPDPHWSALTPAGPLRYWRLIEIGAGHSLTQSPLRIDERILHLLAGLTHLDERLNGFIDPPPVSNDQLTATQQRVVTEIVTLWSRDEQQTRLPAIQLCGRSAPKRGVAEAAAREMGLDLKTTNAGALPVDPRELDALMHLWDREAALTSSALFLDCDTVDPGDSNRAAAIQRVIAGVRSVLFVSTVERRSDETASLLTFEVARPTADEQAAIWRQSLGDISGADEVADSLSGQFNLPATAIQSVSGTVLAVSEPGDDLGGRLWDACRVQSRPRIETLALRIEPLATWDDLVLPDAQLHLLREVAVHVRQRGKVYRRWGFASRYSRGLGISLLAAGPSGAGKTMAAEVLANELRLDLFQIDLSQVVSKYIGETEKNLGRLFDAAEGGGAILLFDEADALFGKRSEVKDSHDRYANIEVSYLLQRVEAFSGLAILTTNMKEALDSAFLRRIRFVVQFPFPDAGQRAAIWSRVFPASTPSETLDFERLARLNLSGGSIRNVAMNAAFLAAESGEPVRMIHLAGAARAEFAKLERPLSETEIGAWK